MADASMPYGDVSYADPGYQSDGKKRYPLDSEEHCRSAWSYINQAGNAAKYSPDQLKNIKARIMAAGKKYGITFADQQRDAESGEYRGHPHPGQKYKHGWIPIGGLLTPRRKREHLESSGLNTGQVNLALDAPTSMSEVADELHGLNPEQQRRKMESWGWKPHEINDHFDAPNSMGDVHLELSGLTESQQRQKMKGWGWSRAEIADAIKGMAAFRSSPDAGEYRRVPDTVTRGFDFEMRSASSDGRSLEGYVAMFGSVARIPDRGGDFDEELHPGFADRSLAKGYPVMQFDHGKDPRVGTVPIGVYDTFDKDSRGYYVRGRLFDNPVVEPVRQAIQGQAIKGMSFRFSVRKPGGDRWNRRNRDGVDKRDILDADVHEAGPVVFPAYAQTSVTVRSLLASASEEDRQALIEELADAIGEAVEIPYFTGQWAARSAHGGENDDESWEDEASTPSTEAARALALLRPVLP